MQYYISDIPELRLNILPGDIIFLRGNLGSGKTTLTQEILFQRGISREKIKSPTYTYFQKYIAPLTNETFYHFDLYRIGEYEVFLNIWGEEYLDDPLAVKLIEWPEILEHTFVPDIEIRLSDTENPNTRNIVVTYLDTARQDKNIA